MEVDWKAISENISHYIDDDTFLSSTKPLHICKVLNSTTLTPTQFSNLFKNLADYHGKDDMFKMMSRAHIADFKTRKEVEEVEEIFNSVFGIPTLTKIFSFYKNGKQLESQNETEERRCESSSRPLKLPNYVSFGRGGFEVILKCSGSECIISGIDIKHMDTTQFFQQFQKATGISADQYKLRAGNKQIQHDHPLSDYNIQPGSILNLAWRNRGGKPVIYLYPMEEMDVNVNIKINDGIFSFVYPSFDEGSTWKVKANPSGEIKHRGKKMRYLFWETLFYPNLNMERGFVIKGQESIEFFEDKLKMMNLNDAEICDFITYWCPKLVAYKFVKICFQFENFDEMCPMTVEPKPQNINRVFFAALPLDIPEEIEPQDLPRFKRDGFTVIEWGGTIVSTLNY
ncbi:Ubiquitin family protein [Trichomonas vaginalis G3]|uniref:Ubiquitin family protein n=1 Tax=Trichomonas vaginalis (strain ATCC PRA-98 / G3) TaxID=412133 RepID=A2E190_TRIV3|nr:ubiquitin-like family [Trichomonas vaginalis G3]EAY13591.1 Ubiquitin family protein [Trichomonas vaginalis G3]KAI5486419.1 ubiquitin-like family [Trichomonas vaginalis G3]|eukprot:XP_001325814.1 Ubiquitin family protein [Trichomonas vaginalis G3]